MYNILWLDDDFVGPDFTNGEDIVNARREGFLDDVALSEKFGLSIDPALTIDEFREKFTKNPEKYQAVVLDIMDLNPEDASDESAMAEALHLVNKTNVLVYIYSNNPNKPGHRDYIKVNVPAEHVISKAGDISTELYSKIIADLDNELQYFKEHDECLQLLNNEYLVTNSQMKSILKNMKDETYLPFNDMRQVLENMLETLTEHGIIPTNTVGNDTYATFNKRMDYISQQCPTKEVNGKSIVDWNNPYMPYNDCRHEIKWVIDFMGNITNRYSHYQNSNPNFLLTGELLSEYSNSIRKIAYESFFVTMKWFYGYMKNKF